jgi:hypothetical protein
VLTAGSQSCPGRVGDYLRAVVARVRPWLEASRAVLQQTLLPSARLLQRGSLIAAARGAGQRESHHESRVSRERDAPSAGLRRSRPQVPEANPERTHYQACCRLTPGSRGFRSSTVCKSPPAQAAGQEATAWSDCNRAYPTDSTEVRAPSVQHDRLPRPSHVGSPLRLKGILDESPLIVVILCCFYDRRRQFMAQGKSSLPPNVRRV